MREAEPGGADLSFGTLLGGRLLYAQFRGGYRTGIEPVLLAAAVPARSGARVLEAGCGAGAGLICLAARVGGLLGVGLERDAALASLAARNLGDNVLAACHIVVGDAEAPPLAHGFDHVLANPPWHAPLATASPDKGRDTAKRARPGLPAQWVAGLGRLLRPRGTLTLIIPAAWLAPWLASLTQHRFGAVALLPLWPHAGTPAKLLILHAVLDSRGPARLLPGLVLHEAAGRYTAEADAILTRGAALPLE